MRIFALALSILLPVSSFAADWRNEKLCTTKSIEFKQSKQADCAQAWCARDKALGELCACLRNSESESLRMIWAQGDARHQWSTEVLPIQIDVSSFVLQAFDYMPGPDTPWLFAVREAVSNGMGVNYWKAYALGPQGPSAPLTLHELGVLSLMTRAGNEKSCRLLAGQWQEGYEKGRGGGRYFVATWQQPVAGQWQTASSLPTLHRRYLFAFEKERLAGLGEQMKPVFWFRHPTTRTGAPAKIPEQK